MKVREESPRIGGCPIGNAVFTTGGDLTARREPLTIEQHYEPGEF